MNGELLSLRNTKVSKDTRAELMISALPTDARGKYLPDELRNSMGARWLIQQGGDQHFDDTADESAGVANSAEPPVMINAFSAYFREWLSKRDEDSPHIFIDISSLSRPSMADIFATLFAEAHHRRLSVTVGYVIAAFSPPPDDLPPNEDIRPVSEAFAGWPSHPAATTALIVGLGYEREKAEGACEYFDSSDTRVFVPSSPISQYDQAIEANNAQLLGRALRRQHANPYNVLDPEKTFGQLISVTSSLVARSNPVILPFGPKIFFVLSLIASRIHKEIGVWHVTGDIAPLETSYEPSEHVVGFRIELGPT